MISFGNFLKAKTVWRNFWQLEKYNRNIQVYITANNFPHFPHFLKGNKREPPQIQTSHLFVSYKIFYGGTECRTEIVKCFNCLLSWVLLLHFLKCALTNTLLWQDTIKSLKETTLTGKRGTEGKEEGKFKVEWIEIKMDLWDTHCQNNSFRNWILQRKCSQRMNSDKEIFDNILHVIYLIINGVCI